jgi:hypothetical protein
MYYIYAGDKGWWGETSTYVSDVEQARKFTHAEAIEFCRRRTNKILDVSVSHVPVAEADVEAILAK